MIRPVAPPPQGHEEISVQGIRFLAEQDGAPERLLKSQLREFLRRQGGVQRAYLAQVSTGDQVGVALCITHPAGPDRDLVRQVGRIFGAVFNASEHLDIIFLNHEQESALAKVCVPFFGGSVPSR